MLQSTSFNVTTALLVVAACFVIYTRLKDQLDSNVPLIYYGIMILYADVLVERLQPWFVHAGFVLALLLRFEFLNTGFTRVFKLLEFIVLGGIIYECVAMIFRW